MEHHQAGQTSTMTQSIRSKARNDEDTSMYSVRCEEVVQ